MRDIFCTMLCTISRRLIIWLLDNPRCVEVRHQVPQPKNIGYGMIKHRLNRSVFFEDTLTRSRYLELLTDAISDFLEDLPLRDFTNVWFQHDDTPPHKLSSFLKYIWDSFQQQVIGYRRCVEWLPFSSHLNLLDFFLQECIKQQVQLFQQHSMVFETILRMLVSACHLPCSTICSGKCSLCADFYCC